MLFAGSRLDAGFVFTGGQFPGTGTGDGTFNPTYADSSVQLPFTDCQALVYARNAAGALAPVTAGKTFCSHAFWNAERGLTDSGAPVIRFFDSDGYPWLQVYPGGNGGAGSRLQYNSGTGPAPVWTVLAYSPEWSGYLDISVKIDAGGNHTVLWAINASTIFSGNVSIPSLTNLAYVTYYGIDPGRSTYISEVMLSQDIPLINAHVKTLRATGAGNYSQWSGTAADVNEISLNNSNYNRSDTAGQLQSYDMTTLTLPASYTIGGLFYAFIARNDGANAPLNVQGLLRTGGTDYVTSNLTPINPAFGPLQARWDVNPNTGLAWTEANINAMELGFKSIT